jgi:hypothetical protein
VALLMAHLFIRGNLMLHLSFDFEFPAVKQANPALRHKLNEQPINIAADHNHASLT